MILAWMGVITSTLTVLLLLIPEWLEWLLT